MRAVRRAGGGSAVQLHVLPGYAAVPGMCLEVSGDGVRCGGGVLAGAVPAVQREGQVGEVLNDAEGD